MKKITCTQFVFANGTVMLCGNAKLPKYKIAEYEKVYGEFVKRVTY